MAERQAGVQEAEQSDFAMSCAGVRHPVLKDMLS